MLLRRNWLCVLAALHVTVCADFNIYEPGSISNTTKSNISPACIHALEAPIECDQYHLRAALSDSYGRWNASDLDRICTKTCGASLQSYHDVIELSCEGQPDPFPEQAPATLYGGMTLSTYRFTCMKDSAGGYCTNFFTRLAEDLPEDIKPLDLPKRVACSSCFLKLGQHMQSTAYTNYDDSLAEDWAALQKRCDVQYPTEVLRYNGDFKQLPGFAPAGYRTSRTSSFCASNHAYTVVKGDDCVEISFRHSVSTDAVIKINSLLPDCSNLKVGQKLCLPQNCKTYRVKQGDTCWDVSKKHNLSFVQLRAWNPRINGQCTNLPAGKNICIGQPGPAWKGTAVGKMRLAKTRMHTTETAQPEGPVADGTTLECGAFYEARNGDTCRSISLKKHVTVSMLRDLNGGLNENCSNLEAGTSYCVRPVRSKEAAGTGKTRSLLAEGLGAEYGVDSEDTGHSESLGHA